MMVQLDAILQPSDFRSRETGGHAEERDLPAQHVIQFEMGRLHDLRTLKKIHRVTSLYPRLRLLDVLTHIFINNSHPCFRNSAHWQDSDWVSGWVSASCTSFLGCGASLYLCPLPLLYSSLEPLIRTSRAAGISSFDLRPEKLN